MTAQQATGQLTPNSVASHLVRLAEDLDARVTSLDEAERDAVNAREDYTMALAKSFLTAEGAMDIRKHKSLAATHTERLTAELAEARVRGLRRQIDSVKVRIDVGRSVGIAVRTELNLGGIGSGA